MTTFAAVRPPDESTRQAALERHRELTKPPGSLGRLEELGAWLAACQGNCPPEPLRRPRIVVFAGDHGVATRGVSAYPSEVTAQMVANIVAGGAAINVLAAGAGAGVRVVDLSVDSDVDTPEPVREFKVRRSSGAIDIEDALTDDEVTAALAAGTAIADAEVDAGADLLVAGDLGIGNTTVAATLVATLTGTEPVAVVGRGTGIDDTTWMRKTAAIRDALRRARPVSAEPIPLLRTIGGADIAAMAAFLAQAAVRRTPVVLDGVVATAAALVAEELAPGARTWWVAGHRSPEPAHAIALTHLDLDPLLDLGMRLGEGSGAAAAIPLLTASVAVLTDMATFTEAGVSGPSSESAEDPTTDTTETNTDPANTEPATSTKPTGDAAAEPADHSDEPADTAKSTDSSTEPADNGADPAKPDTGAAGESAGTTDDSTTGPADPSVEPPATPEPGNRDTESAGNPSAHPATGPSNEPTGNPSGEPLDAAAESTERDTKQAGSSDEPAEADTKPAGGTAEPASDAAEPADPGAEAAAAPESADRDPSSTGGSGAGSGGSRGAEAESSGGGAAAD
jgi:nicotinate-nucleotide--dimethylbenzimidazole phosphoribosyltransferase